MQTLGKIAGGWGLLALVAAVPSWFLATRTQTALQAGVGVALIAVFLVTRRGGAGGGSRAQETQRGGFYWATTLLMGAAALVLLGAVNFIVARRAKPIDLTAKKIFSLAPQTEQALKGLTEPVKAYAFIASDHPAYDVAKNLLDRYASESDKFTYELKDPRKSIELNARYQVKEGQTTIILARGSGPTESHTAVNALFEEDVTNALLKLSASGTQKVYFLTGHGEWPISPVIDPGGMGDPPASVSELKKSLEHEGYAVEALDLTQTQNEIPKDAAMLVVAHASEPFPAAQLAAVEKYLGQGGRLLYFADWDAESGLEPTLAKWGIQIEPGVVGDALNPGDPYRAIGFWTDHEVSSILKRLNVNPLIDTARGLTVVKEGTFPGVTTTPVLLSSTKSWIETTPENPEPSDGERLGAIPLIMASSASTRDAADKRFDEARVLVFGDASIILDARWGHEVIRNLVMNAFGWTSSQVQKITIRPPDRDISVIDLSDDLMGQLRFLSILGLPQLLIALGIAVRVSRRSR